MSLRRAQTPTIGDPIAAAKAAKEAAAFTAADPTLAATLPPRSPTYWDPASQENRYGSGRGERVIRAEDLWCSEGRQSGGSTSTKPMGASIGTARGFRWRQVA